MGSSCSTNNKIFVVEPTILEKKEIFKENNFDSPQKDYPVFSQNAKGLRQLAHYNKYPEEVKYSIEKPKFIN